MIEKIKKQYMKIFVLNYSVTIAQRTHPYPFRTRKLSSATLMILGG